MSVTLTPQQESAVKAFKAWFESVSNREHEIAPFFLQMGYAGTGKTTVLPFFIEATGLNQSDVTFCAPTGKAAKVMTKKLREQGFTKPAVTIHKAMYRPLGLKYHAIEAEISRVVSKLEEGPSPAERQALTKTLRLLKKDLQRAYKSSAPTFQLNADSEAMRDAKLIVVDEASMVGERIADDMLSFGTPVLAIGDPGQLQPVGDNPGFFVREPDSILTEIHRQALENPIIWASKLIREGKDVPFGSHGGGLLRVLKPSEDDVTYDMSRDVQIIVGTNKKRHSMTRKLRELSGFAAAGPSVGEMMIIGKNSRKHPNLVNGTILRVTHDTGELHSGDVTCLVRTEDEDGMPYNLVAVQGILEENYLGVGEWTASAMDVRKAMEDQRNHIVDWAYAITCHKSQGSQWNDVCVHDESEKFRDQARQWLYTGVTRAAETLTLVRR